MAKVISIINYKGGVGKTTLAVNMAACLARDFGVKTLLVDMDPQCNASRWLMGERKWAWLNNGADRWQSVLGVIAGRRNAAELGIVQPFDDPSDKLGGIRRLYLLPAVERMINLENAIISKVNAAKITNSYTAHSEHKLLEKNLKRYAEDNNFDLIIIDCAPNLYNLTKNALCFSDYYLIPCIADNLSTMGLRQLIKSVDLFCASLKQNGRAQKWPIMLGVIYSRYQDVAAADFGKRMVKASIKDLKKEINYTFNGVAEIKEDIPIRQFVAHQHAVQNYAPICLWATMQGGNAIRAADDIYYVSEWLKAKLGI